MQPVSRSTPLGERLHTAQLRHHLDQVEAVRLAGCLERFILRWEHLARLLSPSLAYYFWSQGIDPAAALLALCSCGHDGHTFRHQSTNTDTERAVHVDQTGGA